MYFQWAYNKQTFCLQLAYTKAHTSYCQWLCFKLTLHVSNIFMSDCYSMYMLDSFPYQCLPFMHDFDYLYMCTAIAQVLSTLQVKSHCLCLCLLFFLFFFFFFFYVPYLVLGTFLYSYFGGFILRHALSCLKTTISHYKYS